MMARDTPPQNATGLNPNQLATIEALFGGLTVTEAAGKAGVDRTTVHRWLSTDALFVATLNQMKQDRLEAVRNRIRSTSDSAVKTIQELIESPDVHPSIKLRAALAVLGALGGLEPEKTGPTKPEDIQGEWRRANRLSLMKNLI